MIRQESVRRAARQPLRALRFASRCWRIEADGLAAQGDVLAGRTGRLEREQHRRGNRRRRPLAALLLLPLVEHLELVQLPQRPEPAIARMGEQRRDQLGAGLVPQPLLPQPLGDAAHDVRVVAGEDIGPAQGPQALLAVPERQQEKGVIEPVGGILRVELQGAQVVTAGAFGPRFRIGLDREGEAEVIVGAVRLIGEGCRQMAARLAVIVLLEMDLGQERVRLRGGIGGHGAEAEQALQDFLGVVVAAEAVQVAGGSQ